MSPIKKNRLPRLVIIQRWQSVGHSKARLLFFSRRLNPQLKSLKNKSHYVGHLISFHGTFEPLLTDTLVYNMETALSRTICLVRIMVRKRITDVSSTPFIRNTPLKRTIFTSAAIFRSQFNYGFFIDMEFLFCKSSFRG